MPRKKAEVSEEVKDDGKEKDTSLAGKSSETGKGAVAKTTPIQSFYDVDYNETDRNLSSDQLREWTAIYASYRSRTPLTGTVVGVDRHRIKAANPETGEPEQKEITCLVVMDFRIKVIIPQTEIWGNPEKNYPDYIVRRMVGAKIDYVITNVDRAGDCATASRRAAMGYRQGHFFRDSRKTEPGTVLTCNVLVVGPKRILAECNGFDVSLSNRDLSYTAIMDLRDEYRPGQEIKAKLLYADKEARTIKISVKELNPNPFDGADMRHPVNSIRQAVISGTYAGGVFCRLPDDTNCLCLYSPGYFGEEFYIGDTVKIVITMFDYSRKLIYGKILEKM